MAVKIVYTKKSIDNSPLTLMKVDYRGCIGNYDFKAQAYCYSNNPRFSFDLFVRSGDFNVNVDIGQPNLKVSVAIPISSQAYLDIDDSMVRFYIKEMYNSISEFR